MRLDDVAGVPAALVGESNQRGVVILLHGLGGSKHVQLAEAEKLAEHGFVAVVLDAVGRGTYSPRPPGPRPRTRW